MLIFTKINFSILKAKLKKKHSIKWITSSALFFFLFDPFSKQINI